MSISRTKMLKQVQESSDYWDVIIIGGGATGLGTAVDAASRGYKTLLLEQHDFAKGTSSRSTKLVHGGVRYLQQGNISLVLEALRERGLLIQNAPHLVKNQSFIVPNYDWWEGPFYGIGMRVYDMLAGKLGLGPSKNLSREETLEMLPTIESEGLKGGVIYYDGQFDDSRLAINLAQTAIDHDATCLNYTRVSSLLKSNGYIDGVSVRDQLTGDIFEVHGRVVVNATGVFADDILEMDESDAQGIIVPSQGVHIMLDKDFLPGESAIMVPHTEDGRVLFAVPWHDKILVGTTDTPVDKPVLEPKPLEEEVDFILKHASQYLTGNPTRKNVKSIFAGLRPLVSQGASKDTAEISRDHTLLVSLSGLVTIAGGKWTTYRKMAEDTVNKAAAVAGLQEEPCVTEDLRLHGWLKNVDHTKPLHYYGADQNRVEQIIEKQPELGKPLHKALPYIKAEVLWAVRNEMALTVEDVLARRMRALILDAQASIEMAPEVARLMADEMNHDQEWIEKQIADYTELARSYL